VTARLIINAAITGCVLDKSDTSHLPVTVKEMTDCARQVREAGASIVHLHARDADGRPVCDAAAYRELVSSVRQACPDLVVCVSLSGRLVADVGQRAAALEARPDLASLTLGSMNFPTQASVNPPETIRELAARIHAAGAVPKLEAFEAGHINYAAYLISKGLLRPPHYFNLILGSLGAAPLDLVGLGHMVGILPPGSVWSVGGIGRHQLDANLLAIAAGGHVRVGLEDNNYFDRARTDRADNVRLVERIARIAREVGRDPATPAEARSILGLGVRESN
jgi:3-keto-5-aminohexanoate cleavage enzyme